MNENIDFENSEDQKIIINPKSSVKLIKNSRGVNWEVKLVSGEENLIESLMKEAINIHKQLEKEIEQDE